MSVRGFDTTLNHLTDIRGGGSIALSKKNVCKSHKLLKDCAKTHLFFYLKYSFNASIATLLFYIVNYNECEFVFFNYKSSIIVT